MKHWGIRTYVILLAFGPAATIAALLAIYFISSRIHTLEMSLHERGIAAAQHLAAASVYPVVSGNKELLDGLMNTTMKERDIYSAVLLDNESKILAGSGAQFTDLPKQIEGKRMGEIFVDAGDYLIFSAPIVLADVKVEDPFRQIKQQQANTGDESDANLGLAIIALSRVQTIQNRNKMLFSGGAITLLGLFLTVALALRLSSRVVKPIQQLSHAVEQIGKGHFNTRVSLNSSGDLFVLEKGVNDMAASLQASHENLQERITESTHQLTKQKEEAERANIAKSRFMAAASHDLRQPMHALGLFVGALVERIQFPEVKAIVKNIEASVTAMDGLLNALLDISRLDAGFLQPTLEAFPIQTLLDSLRIEFSLQALEKGLKFKVLPSSAVVKSDPVLLKRILINLVSNAIRYTHEGGVLVGCRRRGGVLRIEVWDTGIGIPVERREAIFQEFYQLGNPERDRSKGLGLGLAIVERMAKLLGTQVTVQSEPRRGSMFAVEIPFIVKLRLEHQRPVPVAEQQAARFGLFVVIVDDETAILEGIRALLENWGCRTLIATSGQDALTQLMKQNDKPDIVISDYRLRDNENGISVLQAIQALFPTPIPGVLISGDTAPELLRDSEASGYRLLHKPVSPAKLRLLISHLVSHPLGAA